nr:hypothetical protein [Tanacetum cinerariifolium]
MTNKIDTFLKTINGQMTSALLSDTVKNPKLNVYPTYSAWSARSYPMEDPQSSSRPLNSVNAINTTKGVVKRDPQEESTTSTIIPAEIKSKDKGKGILVEEPKPLKKKQQITQDEKFARKLEAELNKNIDWDEAIDHVKKKAKEDPAVKRYQVLKRKPHTEAQARKNMMVYLKNVASFKMDYFKGMSYDGIHPIFEAKFNTNVAFLMKTKEQIEEEESKALKRLNDTPAEKAAKRQKLDKEGRMIAKMDQDADVVLDEVKEVVEYAKVDESVDIQGRNAESQREIYKIDLDHANKVLSMHDDETEPAKVQEVVDVVTTAKLITKVVIATSETITAASETITATEAQVPVVTLTTAPARVTA